MEKSDETPTGPRGPRTTSPDGEPLKQREQPPGGKQGKSSDPEERHQTSPPPPHGDPLRREIPR